LNDESLKDIPASELVDLMDLVVWETSHNGPEAVRIWRDELAARVDASDSEVIRAIAICDEYLAPEGSPEGLAARAKAWPDESA
jgi:hypothetical protein